MQIYNMDNFFFFYLMTNARVNIDSFFSIIFYACRFIRSDKSNFKAQ